MSPIDPGLLLTLPGHAEAAAPFRSIAHWTAANAINFGGKAAIGGIGRPSLSHVGLHDAVSSLANRLLASGIGRGDVVVVSLPNGPEAFVAIMAVVSVAAACPVAPDEPAQAVEPLLARLPIKAVILQDDRPSSVRAMATSRGWPILELRVDPRRPAGRFEIATPLPIVGRPASPSHADDAAVLVRTAGTTDLPKLVLLSQASLLRSSAVLADWLELTEADASLCVMPFTHLHSLFRSTMPVLLKGGMAVCCPGFDPVRILAWISEQRPTIMTAAAGILRTMNLRIAETGWRPEPGTLRLLVSGSDAIDAGTAASLAGTLGVEVREFYGMSEVSPMLAASPKGGIARADGAIGPMVGGWRVRIVDETGGTMPPGEEGEIAVAGGLLNPTVAGARPARMSGPWFLTGDRGLVDPSGALRVTGRVDDRLNRGGEKIAPEAIEAVLAAHPDIRQALVFPIPDDVLGDRVGAIVVPAPGCDPSERELRIFAAERLPDYMVPDRVLAMDSLPVSATGKVARRRLAEVFAEQLAQVSPKTGRTEPATAAERDVARLVASILQSSDFDLDADFNAIGGNSFLALELLIAIEKELDCQLSPAEFLADRSVSGLARLVERRRGEATTRYVVPLRTGNGGPILFLAHAVYGAPTYFNAALPHLDPDIAVYALQWERPKGAEIETLERHAAGYIDAMRAVQPVGPYCLAGHSFAAHLALEVAQQLFAAGEEVAFLAVLDDSADLAKRHFGACRRNPDDDTTEHAKLMLARYLQRPYPGDLWLYRAHDTGEDFLPDPDLGWRDVVCGDFHAVDAAGDHMSMVAQHHVCDWIGGFQEDLRTAWDTARNPDSAREPVPVRLRRARSRTELADVQAVTAARLAGKQGDLAAEIAGYRQAIRLNPDQPFWVYRNLADALEQAGDRAGAAMAYLESAEREATPIFGYALAGTALGLLGRHDAAAAAFAKAEQFDSDDVLVQRAMVALDIRRGCHDRAEARLRRMVAQFADMWSYESISAFLADRQRFDEAIRFATELCDRHPLNARLRRQLDHLVALRAEYAAVREQVSVSVAA